MKTSRLTSSVHGTPTESTKRHTICTFTSTRIDAKSATAAAFTARLSHDIISTDVRDFLRGGHRPLLAEKLVDRRLRLGHERRVIRLGDLHAGLLQLVLQRLLAGRGK